MKIKIFMKVTLAFGFSEAIKSKVYVIADRLSFRHSLYSK